METIKRSKPLILVEVHSIYNMYIVGKIFNELNIAVSENQPCAKCGKEIRVARNRAYPNRIVYCTACYLKYIETK